MEAEREQGAARSGAEGSVRAVAILIYKTHAAGDAFVNEVCVTAAIDDGVGPVALGASLDPATGLVSFDPTPLNPNLVSRAVASDGREAQSYPWSQVDEDWLQAQIDGLVTAGVIAAGDVTLVSGVNAALPAGWQFPAS